MNSINYFISKNHKEITGNPTRLKIAIINRVAHLIDLLIIFFLLKIDRLSIKIFIFIFYSVKSYRFTGKNITLFSYKYNPGTKVESIEHFSIEPTLIQFCNSNNIDGIKVNYWDVDRELLFFSIGFFRKIIKLNTSYIILSSYSTKNYYQPSNWLLSKMVEMGVTIKFIWWDTCSKSFLPTISRELAFGNQHIIIENPKLYFFNNDNCYSHKISPLYTPLLHQDCNVKKSIDVAFMGQISDYRDSRKKYIEYLLNNNISLYYSARSKADQSSYAEYLAVLKKSKIGVNFSMSVDCHQLKARVFETMLSGSLLMEQKNDQIECYFKDGIDYISFESEEDLLDKVNFYLKNKDLRKKIAATGRNSILNNYSGDKFWSAILSF